ncbi:MAG: outer membrane lipoprotein-sorting protein [Pseudomonadota bacterium]
MKPLNVFLVIMVGVLVVFIGNYPTAGAEETSLLLPADCPNCCKKVNLYPGINVNDLMRTKYIVKYTKFANDQESVGSFIMVDKRGLKRSRKWHRYRVILGKDGIDYKDLIVLTEPQHIKGLAVLTWMYLDPNKERDNWIWLPSQRKLRRSSPAEDDDAAFGSDLTNEEITTRNWDDETYAYVNEEGKFEGYTSRHTGKTYYKDVASWVVEATPKRKPWYYSKRILFIPKNIGAQVHDDIFDPNGKKYKDLLRVYEIRENGCIPMTYVECIDHRTDHMTVIEIDWIKLNVGLDEKLLAPKALMRTKW